MCSTLVTRTSRVPLIFHASLTYLDYSRLYLHHQYFSSNGSINTFKLFSPFIFPVIFPAVYASDSQVLCCLQYDLLYDPYLHWCILSHALFKKPYEPRG